MDLLIIGDAGLPVPKGTERVDLGWIEGNPAFLDVLKAVLDMLCVEKATFANEAFKVSPDFHTKTLALLPENIDIEYIDHADLKLLCKESKAVVLTGEFTPYTNVVLQAGCVY
jgi:D-ribose pyranase